MIGFIKKLFVGLLSFGGSFACVGEVSDRLKYVYL